MIADSMGAEVIVTIKGAPEELLAPIATATNGTPTPYPFPCGRITAPQGVDWLSLFIVALLQQLRSDFGLGLNDPPPIQYIELWNEPDAPAYEAVPDYFGCWVSNYDGGTKYQEGGLYYAQVLNAVAPYVKSQFPTGSIKFVAGATMNVSNGFLDEVIDNSIANIDVVSYHNYKHLYSTNCDVAAYISEYEGNFASVRNYLDDHGGPMKPILISEGAMGYGLAQTPEPTFYDCQALFAANLLTWAEGKRVNGNLLGFIWYTIGTNGWRYTDLLYNNGSPKPVYYIWRDFGPSVYLQLVFNNTGSSQYNSTSDIKTIGAMQSGDPYPPPPVDSVFIGDKLYESITPSNPYPAP